MNQIIARHIKTYDTSNDITGVAGGGHGILVCAGGADDVVPGGFPITLRLHFKKGWQDIPMEAPRALFFP